MVQKEAAGATQAPRRSAGRTPTSSHSGYRWLLLALVLLLVPVAALSLLQATRTTDAGRISSRPPAVIFAKPLDTARLPDQVGAYVVSRPENAPALPHGQRDSAYFIREGGQPIRVVLQESQVTSLTEYEVFSGMSETERRERASCGRLDEHVQCVALLRGGLLVAIAVDPATDPQDVAAFTNEVYATLPDA